MSDIRIVIVEDRDQEKQEVLGAMAKAIGKSPIKVDALDWDSNQDGTFESILSEKLSGEHRPSLVVSDHDLTQFDPRLTDNEFELVCQRLLIPLLRYARRNPESERERFGRYLYGDIFLLPLSIEDLDEAARQVVAYAEGFQAIRSGMEKLGSDALQRGHARILAELTGRPELRLEFSLYAGSGPQPVFKHAPSEDLVTDNVERLTYQIGHWLLNSVMRFPGLLLSKPATAAFLNLDRASFERPEIQILFVKAAYSGPFSSLAPHWWRPDLEAILDEANAESGLEIDKTIEGLRPSLDEESKEAGATFICLVTGKPTTEKNSVGRLNWIPQGASQSRISKSQYDTWAPYFSQ